MVLMESGVIELFEIVSENDLTKSIDSQPFSSKTRVLAELEFKQIEFMNESQKDKSVAKVAIEKMNVRVKEQINSNFTYIVSTLHEKKQKQHSPYSFLIRYEYGFTENEIRKASSKNSKIIILF